MESVPGMKVIKRTGDAVAFDGIRIRNAIQKAFVATKHQSDPNRLDELVTEIATEVQDRFLEFFPNVENIQDIVEKHLVRAGEYEVAKAYILYRADRQREREELKTQTAKRARLGRLTVVCSDGRTALFNLRRVEDSVRRAAEGLKEIAVDQVSQEVVKSVYDGITTEGIANALVLAAASFVERDPEYSKLSARLLLRKLKQETLSQFGESAHDEQAYRMGFVENLRHAVDAGVLDQKLLDFDLEMLASRLCPERDDLLEYLGLQTLYERYLLKVESQLKELPQMLFMRAAMGVSIFEDDPNRRALEFYELMSNLRYIPSTPTLFHSGTAHPQLSSCYLTTIQDNLQHIFKCLADNAQLSKWSGGIGNDWTGIRGTGSTINSTKVESQGVVPFLKIANDVTNAINRSGKRRGATCAYLETWHYDIEDFLSLRKNTGDERRRTHDMNTANWIPDLFMKRVLEDQDWTLFSSDEVPDLHDLVGRAFEDRYLEYEARAKQGEMALFKVIPAKNLWRKMLTMLFETGHPWITFKDPCNIRSPQDHVGVVHSSNLCTEITLNTSPEETAVCNLGSVNLSRHITDGKLDNALLSGTVESAIRMLDNVIDINFYPTEEARASNLKHRPIGLGQMGLQDALFQMDLAFESDQALEFVDCLSEFISYHAILASSKLAKERGSYGSFRGSKWDRGIMPLDTLDVLEEERGRPVQIERTSRLDWGPVREHVSRYGMRNSNTMAIAPTATISNISGCFPCTEPMYKNIYVKANISGEFTIVNRYLVQDLKDQGLWHQEMLDKLKYYDGNLDLIPDVPEALKVKHKEAFQVDPIWAVRMAATRAKWIDQSQSHNVFMQGVSGKLLSQIYITAWEMGLKTTYYLRTLAATQIEKATLATKYGFTQKRQYVNGAKEEKEQPVNGQLVNGESREAANLCRIDDPDCEACQ